MKNLSLTFCLAIAALFGSVKGGFAGSDLPPCNGKSMWNGHNCVGSNIFDNGNKVTTGDEYTLVVETIPGLNQNLLSYCQLHRDGFDLLIDEKGGILKHRSLASICQSSLFYTLGL